MIIFILILILLAILYSTEAGRELLELLFLLPFKIIWYPFRIIKKLGEEATRDSELKRIEMFKKSLGEGELECGY